MTISAPAMMTDPTELTALAARDRLARGEVKAVDLTEALLKHIVAREPQVNAFAFLDEQLVRTTAKRMDDYRGTGRSLGALHGLAVGVKDVVDTIDMPTQNGTDIDAERRPGRDATIVHRLRAAGAIVIGKTATAELAYLSPARTRNPRDPARTPGGSSAGSAAAVAAGMVPLAVGTQTAGSVIRPASFCGVVGFKPTFGAIPRGGIRMLSAPLDTVGVFARTVTDAALLADALVGYDPSDRDSLLAPPPRMLDVALTDPPITPELAFVKTPAWGQAEPATREGFAELVETLGKACSEVTLPDLFAEGAGAHRAIMQAGMARNLAGYYRRATDQLSAQLRTAIEDGMKVTAVDYLAALDWCEALNSGLEQLFERYDAIVTPAAPGEAPEGLGSTGNPVFNALWTLCGVPAVTLPLLQGPNGMPVGVQLVGRRGEDARLLRTARWLTATVEAAA